MNIILAKMFYGNVGLDTQTGSNTLTIHTFQYKVRPTLANTHLKSTVTQNCDMPEQNTNLQ